MTRPEPPDWPTVVALAIIGVVLTIFSVGTVALALRSLDVPEVMSTAVSTGIGALAGIAVQRHLQRRDAALTDDARAPE